MTAGTNLKALAVLVAGISAHLALAFGTSPVSRDDGLSDDQTGGGNEIIDHGSLPQGVAIRSIMHAGSGCAAGTVTGFLTDDASSFALMFDDFVVEAGPGVPLSAGRKNCQLAIDLDVPAGWSFSVMNVDVRGFAHLDRDVVAEQKALFYFQGDDTDTTLKTTMTGHFAGDFTITDTVGIEAQGAWSECGAGRALNVNTSFTVRAPHGRHGFVSVDSIDGTLTQLFGLRWKRCDSQL